MADGVIKFRKVSDIRCSYFAYQENLYYVIRNIDGFTIKYVGQV